MKALVKEVFLHFIHFLSIFFVTEKLKENKHTKRKLPMLKLERQFKLRI